MPVVSSLVLGRGNRLGSAWTVALSTGYIGLLVSAVLADLWFFVASLALVLLAEAKTAVHAKQILDMLGKAQLNVTQRVILRDVAVLFFAAQSGSFDKWALAAMVGGFLVVHALRGTILLLRQYVEQRRKLPVLARNLNLDEIRIPNTPPGWIMNGGVRRWLQLTVPAYVGIVADTVLDQLAPLDLMPVLGLAGTGLGVAAGAAATLALFVQARRNRHLGNRRRLLQTIQQRVLEYQPEVVLHYSSAENAEYQVNMWLSTLARLERRPMVVIREAHQMFRIARTTIPIVCIPSGSDLSDFQMPDLKVALYVGNVGKNVHMLRNPKAKHVFIGHGDSDKLASANPVSKQYDQIWVAGRAGRDRYRRARVGVRDDAIVEVGRPQLEVVQTVAESQHRIFTVVYAPTFEGWSKDHALTSVDSMGVDMIAALVARTPGVRVIYKPHPLTGVRSRAVRRAHGQIMRILGAANRARLADPMWRDILEQGELDRQAARARLTEIDARTKELRTSATRGDRAEQARNAGIVDTAVEEELDLLEHQWRDAYWRSVGWWNHKTVQGSRPDLYSCFNQADLMISDISSVVSDFIASDKPYILCNVSGMSDEEFRSANTVAGGAYLMRPGCEGFDDLITALQTPAGDHMAVRRRETKHYLLGPDSPPAMDRFRDAVEALVHKRRGEQLEAFGYDANRPVGRAPVVPQQKRHLLNGSRPDALPELPDSVELN